jgi:hypothetical protein
MIFFYFRRYRYNIFKCGKTLLKLFTAPAPIIMVLD